MFNYGIAEKNTEDWIITNPEEEFSISYIKSLEKINPTLSTEPNISLSTIHMAKGGECDNVMLLTDLSPANQEEMATNPDDTNRAFYVAVTRAKRQLHIVDSQSYGGFEI